MTQYIYMNHRIREKKPSGPVIVVQDNFRRAVTVREADEFDLWFYGTKIGRVVFNPKGLKACETHEVKAWVELDDLVDVADPKGYVPPAPVATEKKPNQKVRYVRSSR